MQEADELETGVEAEIEIEAGENLSALKLEPANESSKKEGEEREWRS